MTYHNIDTNEAIALCLKHYPGKNDTEFDSHYGPEAAPSAKEAVNNILREAIKIEPDGVNCPSTKLATTLRRSCMTDILN